MDTFRAIPVEAVIKVEALLAEDVSTGDKALDAGIRAHHAGRQAVREGGDVERDGQGDV